MVQGPFEQLSRAPPLQFRQEPAQHAPRPNLTHTLFDASLPSLLCSGGVQRGAERQKGSGGSG